jgi:hypothetical protein
MRHTLSVILILAAATCAVTSSASAAPKDCPPGLAKKAVPCVPPGQAQKMYRIGDRIDGDYTRLDRPWKYGLERNGTYYRAGDYIYRVDRDTREVLDLIGAAAAVLN